MERRLDGMSSIPPMPSKNSSCSECSTTTRHTTTNNRRRSTTVSSCQRVAMWRCMVFACGRTTKLGVWSQRNESENNHKKKGGNQSMAGVRRVTRPSTNEAPARVSGVTYNRAAGCWALARARASSKSRCCGPSCVCARARDTARKRNDCGKRYWLLPRQHARPNSWIFTAMCVGAVWAASMCNVQEAEHRR